MATNSTSFSNTPQASDDEYRFNEDQAALYGYNSANSYFTWDVMADDLGGKAKKLFSIYGDDSTSTQELWNALKTKDGSGWEYTESGRIRIRDGQIDYQLGTGKTEATFVIKDVQSLNAGQEINDAFTYAIQLGNGTLSYATVSIQITGANDNASISVVGSQDTAVIEAGGVANATAGDASASGTLAVSDVDSGQNTFQAPAPASLVGTYGTFTFVAATGAWTYTLDQTKADALADGAQVTDTLTVSSLDGTATHDIVVNITGSNDAPTITAEVGSPTLADTAAADTFANITGNLNGNDVDAGASLTYSLAAGEDGIGAYGTLTVNADGSYTFVANAAAINALQSGTASDVFNVTVNDGLGGTATTTLTINVSGANDTPTITAEVGTPTLTDTAAADTFANITGSLDGNDVDAGASLAYSLAAGEDGVGVYGTLTVNPDGTYTFVANAAAINALQSGTDADVFNVTVDDGFGGTASTTLTINVSGANDTPTITAEVGAPTLADTAAADTFADVTGSLDGNDVDTGASLAYSLAAGEDGVGTYGSLTVNANGSYTFVANAAAINALQGGTDSDVFNVFVDDGLGGTATTTLTINVSGANDTPTITAEVGTPTLADTSALDSFADISGSLEGADVDAGATLSYSLAVGENGIGTYGTLTVNADGTYTYAANAAAINALQGGTDSDVFSVTVNDGMGGTATTTLTINVSGANDTPTITAEVGSPTLVDTAAADTFANVTGTLDGNDADDGATLSYSLADGEDGIGAYGSLTVNADGTYSFVANAAAINALPIGNASDVFNVTVDDGQGATATTTLTINVSGANDKPTDITLLGTTVDENAAGAVIGTLTTSDVDSGDTHSYTVSDSRFEVVGNQLKLKDGISLDFEAGHNVNISVTAEDAGGLTYSESFTLAVNDVNEAPTAVVLTNTVVSTPENGGAIKVADIGVTDDALGTNVLSLSGTDASAFYISGNALYFSGGADFETKNAYNVTVNVNDASVGGTPDASTNFSLSITDVVENVAPVAQNDKWFISDNTTAALSAATALLGNDSDANGDTFRITALSNDGTTWVTDGTDGTLDNVINLDTSKGILAINTLTGAITYTTDTQTSDTTDTFYYRVTDNNASPMSDEAQVSISVEDIGTGSTVDIVDLSAQTYQVSYISSGNGGDNLTGGSGLDTFLGGAANDILVGGSGNDFIDGGSGDDQITGNAGNDSIDVSAGNDTVFYTSTLDGNDVLTSFDTNASGGQDVINLDALFDTYGTLSGTRADHVNIVQSGSDTLVQVDTNNSTGTYEMTITLSGVTASTVTIGSDVLLGS
jgi:VCBS repeat-containing protein